MLVDTVAAIGTIMIATVFVFSLLPPVASALVS